MMKLMTLPQYMNMSKPALIRKIMKTLKAMPKKRLAMVCYNLTKSKLPRLTLKERGFTAIPSKKLRKGTKSYKMALRSERKRKTKRKFTKRQLAAQRLFAKRARAGTLKRRRR